MMYGSYNRFFGNIKTNIENKITCGSYRHPKTKDRTVGLLNNYHVSNQLTQENPVKE